MEVDTEKISQLIYISLVLTCVCSGVLAYVVSKFGGIKGLCWLSAISVCLGAAAFVLIEYATQQSSGYSVSPAIAIVIPALVIGISIITATNKRWFGIRR